MLADVVLIDSQLLDDGLHALNHHLLLVRFTSADFTHRSHDHVVEAETHPRKHGTQGIVHGFSRPVQIVLHQPAACWPEGNRYLSCNRRQRQSSSAFRSLLGGGEQSRLEGGPSGLAQGGGFGAFGFRYSGLTMQYFKQVMLLVDTDVRNW